MRYLLVGGTGTLGRALIKEIISRNGYESIIVLSRDEFKQKQLREDFPEVTTRLADCILPETLHNHFANVDVVFHLAALKHIDIAEENPIRCIQTNVDGTVNVAQAAIDAEVGNVVFSSTDKAVLPINIYGNCKAVSERYLMSLNNTCSTSFSVFRWGNVIGSRGSVLHSFVKSLKEEGKINLTDPRMTRFWIKIDTVAKYMLDKFDQTDEVNIPPMKSAPVLELGKAVAKYLEIDSFTVDLKGIRPGEKIHECIYTAHSPDVCIRSDNSQVFTSEELLELVGEALA